MSTTSYHSSRSATAASTSGASTSRTPATQAERTKDAHTAFMNSFYAAGAEVDTEMQKRAAIIHEQAKALNKQDKDLQAETKKAAKVNTDSEKWLEKSKKKLADFDDLGDIAEGFDDDLADLEAMLDMLDERKRMNESGSLANKN